MTMTRIEKLNSENLSYRFGAIIDIIDHRTTETASNEEVDCLKQLKRDDRVIAGRKISTYAKAALYLLGIQRNIEGDQDAEQLASLM